MSTSDNVVQLFPGRLLLWEREFPALHRAEQPVKPMTAELRAQEHWGYERMVREGQVVRLDYFSDPDTGVFDEEKFLEWAKKHGVKLNRRPG